MSSQRPRGQLFPGATPRRSPATLGPPFLAQVFQNVVWIYCFCSSSLCKGTETLQEALGGLQGLAPCRAGAQRWTKAFSKDLSDKRHFPVFLWLPPLASKQTDSFPTSPPPHAARSPMERGKSCHAFKQNLSISFPGECPTAHPPQTPNTLPRHPGLTFETFTVAQVWKGKENNPKPFMA